MLEEDADVYKLMGPVLVKQDMMEATSNVEKRVEFINKEMCLPHPPRVVVNILCDADCSQESKGLCG